MRVNNRHLCKKRQNNFDRKKGLAVYDTWMPTEVSGNKFYDFPSLDGDAHRHALGAHLTNKFQMSVKNMIVYNNEVKNKNFQI